VSTYRIESTRPDFEECHVGYDPRIDSYWLYVARKLITERGKVKEGFDGHVIHWLGTTPNEIDSVEELASLVAEHGKLDDSTKAALRDRLSNQSTQAKGRTAREGAT
jgi:hypothetical protein